MALDIDLAAELLCQQAPMNDDLHPVAELEMLDSFEFNKIAGAVLFTLLLILGLGVVSDIVFETHHPEKPGFEIAVSEDTHGGGATEAPAAEAVPLGQLLASADAERGLAVAKKCAACHTFEDGGANKVGPNLHGVAGRDIGSHAGFAYSSALEGLEGNWTWEALNSFISSPKGFAPGTKMAFAGIKKDSDRADLLAYLKSISPAAPEFPAP